MEPMLSVTPSVLRVEPFSGRRQNRGSRPSQEWTPGKQREGAGAHRAGIEGQDCRSRTPCLSQHRRRDREEGGAGRRVRDGPDPCHWSPTARGSHQQAGAGATHAK